MAYRNEIVTEEDVEKYDLKKNASYWMHYRYRKGSMWTVDRENESFLLEIRNNQNPYDEEGVPSKYVGYYLFYWKHTPISFEITKFNVHDPENQPPEITWKLLKMDLPPSLIDRREEVLQALKEAYQGRGRDIFSNNVSTVYFENWN